MNKTQRIHVIKRVLRQEFDGVYIQKLPRGTMEKPVNLYGLRNTLRLQWAEEIEKALFEGEK